MGSLDLDILVPAWYAAQRAQVSRQTLNYWVRSGKLAQAVDDDGAPAVGPRGEPLYRLRDALLAEAQTRRAPQSHRGVARPGAGRPPGGEGSWARLDRQTSAT